MFVLISRNYLSTLFNPMQDCWGIGAHLKIFCNSLVNYKLGLYYGPRDSEGSKLTTGVPKSDLEPKSELRVFVNGVFVMFLAHSWPSFGAAQFLGTCDSTKSHQFTSTFQRCSSTPCFALLFSGAFTAQNFGLFFEFLCCCRLCIGNHYSIHHLK